MLPLLGKSCPSLSHLSVNGYTLYVDILLALILGEAYFEIGSNNALLPPSLLKNDKLECLVIPPERLSPICFTLIDFRLETIDQDCTINASAISFALRHLPLVERMGKTMPVSLAIKILYNSSTFRVQEEWRNAFKDPDANQLIFSRNLGVNFTGHLSLTRVDFVNVRYEEMLLAVGAMCPSLKEVVFCNETFHSEHDYARSPLLLENPLSPETLESVLKKWPQKLTLIGFNKVLSSYMTPILKVFGQQLHNLEVKSCFDIKLTDLALCSQLESLQIHKSSLDPREWISTNDASAFLPHLTTFESDSCLGPSSRLFEEKPTLVSLVLHCSHIGVNDECRRSNRFLNSMEEGQLAFIGWIAELWSHLETLAIQQFAGLSMKTIIDIIPKLRKLREVTLPERISSYDRPLFLSIKNELVSRKPPVEISFAEFDDSASCPVLEHY